MFTGFNIHTSRIQRKMVAAVGAVITEVNTQTTKKILALAAIHRHFLSVILSCPAEKKKTQVTHQLAIIFFTNFVWKLMLTANSNRNNAFITEVRAQTYKVTIMYIIHCTLARLCQACTSACTTRRLIENTQRHDPPYNKSAVLEDYMCTKWTVQTARTFRSQKLAISPESWDHSLLILTP